MRIYSIFVGLISIPIVLDEFFQTETGRDYGIGFTAKLNLVFRVWLNRRRIVTSSFFLEHLIIATRVLRIPKSVEGSVVECGSFRGGSTVNLSLVCGLCHRKLEVFDSFSGLPASDSTEVHTLLDRRKLAVYAKGAYAGTEEEVRRNVSRYGDIGICEFHPGYFEDTLPQFKRDCVLAFVDVDLRDSLVTCLRNLWPLLLAGSYFFVHEAHHLEMAQIFFDTEWWRRNAFCPAPGLVGAGSGLGLYSRGGPFRSDLGYTIKNPDTSSFVKSSDSGIDRSPTILR